MRCFATTLAAAGLFVLAPGAALAGAAFEFETHYVHTGAVGSTPGYAEDAMLRMGVLALDRTGEDGTVLYRPQDGVSGVLYVEDRDGEVITLDGEAGIAGIPGMGAMSTDTGMAGMPTGAMPGAPDPSQMPGLTDAQRRQLADALAAAQNYAAAGGASEVPGMLGAMTGVTPAVAADRVVAPAPGRSLEGEPNAVAYDVTEGERLRYTVYALDVDDVAGGRDIDRSFAELAVFLRLPSMPEQMSDGMWVFDVTHFDGRLPVAIDEYGQDGEVMIERRLINAREEDVDDALFEPFIAAN